MSLVSSCCCFCAIYWSQGLSREWKCSWIGAEPTGDSQTTSEWWTIYYLVRCAYIRDLRVIVVKASGGCFRFQNGFKFCNWWFMDTLTTNFSICIRKRPFMAWESFPHWWPFCDRNPLVFDVFCLYKGPVMQRFDVFFVFGLQNYWTKKQWICCLFETPWCSYDVSVMQTVNASEIVKEPVNISADARWNWCFTDETNKVMEKWTGKLVIFSCITEQSYVMRKWSSKLWTDWHMFAHHTISLLSLCGHIWRYWTSEMLVRYILSSVCLRSNRFSQSSLIRYLGLCVFSLPIFLMMILRICLLILSSWLSRQSDPLVIV